MRRITLALAGALLLSSLFTNTVLAGKPILFCVYVQTPHGNFYCKPVLP